MAAKKYLSLEEAAEQLAMPVSQLNKLRESGTLRGFADRGTWKFKADDVAEFGRTREVSSDPDVPLMLDDDFGDDATVPPKAKPKGGGAKGGGPPEGGQTLEIRMPGEEDDDAELADAPTLVRGAADDDASDSDVRLAVDSSVGDMRDAASGPIDLMDDSSDVRLVSDESSVLIGGAGSDSDVRLIADDGSSVTAGDGGSDSDVALVGGSSATGRSVLDDDQPSGGFGDSQLTLGADSGIALDSPLDSGIALSSGDSDVTLSEDSGLALAADSGFDRDDDGDDTDAADADSAIALMDDANDDAFRADDVSPGEDGSSIILLGDDSGIALAADSSGTNLGDSGVADSGIALDFLNDEDDDAPSKTKSLAAAGAGAAGAAGAANLGATEADMSAVSEDAGYALAADDEEGGADTSVILFEDDDEDDFGEEPAAPAQGGSQFELEEDFDDFDGDAGFASGSAVSAEILEEDDDLDVFEASDDDFDDEFQSRGQPRGVRPGRRRPRPRRGVRPGHRQPAGGGHLPPAVRRRAGLRPGPQFLGRERTHRVQRNDSERDRVVDLLSVRRAVGVSPPRPHPASRR